MNDTRKRFAIPRNGGKEVIYLCGNSLGLMPHAAAEAVQLQLTKWASEGVEGHFSEHYPWYSLAESLKENLAHVVGGLPHEVAAMGSLSSNLHHLMASFYRPTSKKHKILIEKHAFPSDLYIAQSQLKWHGYDPESGLILLSGDQDNVLHTAEVLDKIEENTGSLALVFLPGVQYHTGQFLDIEKITAFAASKGITVGFDLAHAAGNVPMKLHEWGVDFASWCSYKYLNAGPGAIAGIFVHEKHNPAELPLLAGWWGYPAEKRFQMKDTFIPAVGADGWVQSNPNVLSLASLKASLEIFASVGMPELRKKSMELTDKLEIILTSYNEFEIITPSNPAERGCQLSFRVRNNGRDFFDQLIEHGVIGDWRVPDIIRLAPAPLYNTMEDLDNLDSVIKNVLA